MLTDGGVELIFHIGIDTIKLNGQGFFAKVQAGQRVVLGDTLVEFDLEAVKRAGFDPVVIMVITNSERFTLERLPAAKHINDCQIVMSLKESV